MIQLQISQCPTLMKNVTAFPMLPYSSSLKEFVLYDTGLNTSLPMESDFGKDSGTLCNLTKLTVTDASLHGPVRAWKSCTKLRYLNLAKNKLEGKIETILTPLKALRYMYLFDNVGIYGSLPDIPMPSLKCLDLRLTSVSGEIPPQYFQLNSLMLPGKTFSANELNANITKADINNDLKCRNETERIYQIDTINSFYIACERSTLASVTIDCTAGDYFS